MVTVHPDTSNVLSSSGMGDLVGPLIHLGLTEDQT